jgi:hypothetical protein
VSRVRGTVIAKWAGFSSEFEEGGGLKNRCRVEGKTSIAQVLNQLILSVCRRWLSGRKRRFAKVAGDHRTGLKFTISGPFLLVAWLALAAG